MQYLVVPKEALKRCSSTSMLSIANIAKDASWGELYDIYAEKLGPCGPLGL